MLLETRPQLASPSAKPGRLFCLLAFPHSIGVNSSPVLSAPASKTSAAHTRRRHLKQHCRNLNRLATKHASSSDCRTKCGTGGAGGQTLRARLVEKSSLNPADQLDMGLGTTSAAQQRWAAGGIWPDAWRKSLIVRKCGVTSDSTDAQIQHQAGRDRVHAEVTGAPPTGRLWRSIPDADFRGRAAPYEAA